MPKPAPQRTKRLPSSQKLYKPHGHERLEPHAYLFLLGMKTRDTAELLRKVEDGLSYKALERLQKTIDLSFKQMAEQLRIPPRTLSRRREQGRLEPDESDRLLRLSRIFAHTLGLFEGDDEAAKRWLRTPQRACADSPPMEFAKTELGAREVEHLIGQLEHGIPA